MWGLCTCRSLQLKEKHSVAPCWCVVILSLIRWGQPSECGTVTVRSLLQLLSQAENCDVFLPSASKNFCERGERVFGVGSARLYTLGPPRRVLVRSADVVVCNLCHVLVGNVGVVHLPLRLWFTGGFWVLSRTLMLDSKESLQKRPGFGMSQASKDGWG